MEKLDFGNKLIEVRKAKGLTQEEVAEKCKITVRTIQRIESGIVTPRAYTIKNISDALGFDFFEASNTGYDVNKENQNPIIENHNLLWYLTDLFNLKTNTMKKVSILTTSSILVGLAMFVFISKTSAQSDNKNVFKSIAVQYNDDKSIKRIEVRFSSHLTFDSLTYIKNELYTKGIIVDYKKIDFDNEGHLEDIDCEVRSNLSGESGSFSAIGLNKNEKIGFFYDYSKNAKIKFCTGECNL